MTATAQDLIRIADKLPEIIEATVQELAEIGQHAAQTSQLFKGGTGDNSLRNNIKIIPSGSYTRTVLADKDYAYYVEYGNAQSGPIIYPKRAKALRFVANGKTIFAKWVRASKPRPFMAAAELYTETKYQEVFANKYKEIIGA